MDKLKNRRDKFDEKMNRPVLKGKDVFVAKTTIFLILFFSFFAFSGSVSAVTADELKIQIDNIIKQLNQLQSQIQSTQSQTAQSANTQKLTCPKLTYNLYFGLNNSDTENQISELQKFLAQDTSIYPEGKITGYFGPATERAVKRYQAKYNIASSGSPETTGYGAVGPQTRQKMTEGCQTQTQSQTQTTPLSEAPKIISISPQSGYSGDQITILGSGFTDNNTIIFNAQNYQAGPLYLYNRAASDNGAKLTFTVPYIDTKTASPAKVIVQNSKGASNEINFTLSVKEIPVIDTTAPSQVSNLIAKYASGSVDLTWSAATDNVGVKEYLVYIWDNYSRWILLGQTSNLNYSDKTQRTPDAYYYAVVAKDQAGNAPDIINWARVDISQPVTPVKIDSLSTPSGSNIGHPRDSITIQGRGFTKDNNTAIFNIMDIFYPQPQAVFNLFSSNDGASIFFTVPNVAVKNGTQAKVYIKNTNGESNLVDFTFLIEGTATTTATIPSTDTTAPSQVSNLIVKYTGSSVDLAWSAATDNVGIKEYLIYLWDNTSQWNLIGQTVNLSYSDKTQRQPNTYYYSVVARDATGNAADIVNWVSVNITAPVQQQTVQNPQISSICPQSAYSGQQLVIYGANFVNNNTIFFVSTGQQVKNLPSYNNGATLILNVPDLGASSFQMKIFVKNANANIDSNQVDFQYLGKGSGFSSGCGQTFIQQRTQQQTQQQIQIQIIDNVPPGQVGNLKAAYNQKLFSKSIDLTWFPATDNVGVAEYYIYLWYNNNWQLIDKTANTSYSDTTFKYPASSFGDYTRYYAVIARDAAGNMPGIVNWAEAYVPRIY